MSSEEAMRKCRAVPSAISLGLFLSSAQVTAAGAAEVKVFTARAIATVLNEIGPEFERATGHRLNVISGLPPQFIRQINAGEPVDVVVTGSPVIDGLIKDGKVIADTRTNLVRSGIGVEVRAGAPKPDISSVEAFKRALLNARSIGYLKVGSGIYWLRCWTASASPRPSRRRSRGRTPISCPSLSPRAKSSFGWSSVIRSQGMELCQPSVRC